MSAVVQLPDPEGMGRLAAFAIRAIRGGRAKRRRRKRAIEWWLRLAGILGRDEELTKTGFRLWKMRLGDKQVNAIVKRWHAEWAGLEALSSGH